MAERRMFTKKITDADEFIALPSSTQAFYLHLTMSADDDGFNNQVQMAMFKAHASVDDLRLLLAKRFIIQFSNGVIVIKHWRMANALRKDRYTATAYQEELKMLKIKDNGAYSLTDDSLVANWLPNGCQTVAVGKDSIGENSIEENSIDKSSCGELNESATPQQEEPSVISLILVDKTEYGVTQGMIDTYKECYPAVDIMQELRNMKAWCISNPPKRKTRNGVGRFINNWLAKAQNRGGGNYGQSAKVEQANDLIKQLQAEEENEKK